MAPLIDFHCDTLAKAMQAGGLAEVCPEWHLDPQRLRQVGVSVQVFAVWSNPRSARGALADALAMIELFWQAVTAGLLRPILIKEHVSGESGSLPGGLLSIEGAEPLHGDEAILRALFRLGVRAVGLTWNGRNEVADGVGEAESKGGLTAAGRRIVKTMAELGMVVDVSHLAPVGFWDVAELLSGPFVASHSNAHSVCPHPRNLTDDQLRAVAAKNGVVGLNLYPKFLTENPRAHMEDVLRHAEHMVEVMGPSHVGLGSDFDGISTTPVGLGGTEQLPELQNSLVSEFGQEIAAGIMGGNFARLLHEILPSALH